MTIYRQDRGASLLELVAVMAIFSLLAVMSLQLLTSAVRNQAHIAEAGNEVSMIAAGLSVLRRDLEYLQPVSGPLPNTPERLLSGLSLSAEGRKLTMITGSEKDSAWHVQWVLEDDGQLKRTASSLNEDIPETTTIMARGISQWSIEFAEVGGAWRSNLQTSDNSTSNLPRGVKIVLQHEDLGDLRLVAVR